MLQHGANVSKQMSSVRFSVLETIIKSQLKADLSNMVFPTNTMLKHGAVYNSDIHR